MNQRGRFCIIIYSLFFFLYSLISGSQKSESAKQAAVSNNLLVKNYYSGSSVPIKTYKNIFLYSVDGACRRGSNRMLTPPARRRSLRPLFFQEFKSRPAPVEISFSVPSGNAPLAYAWGAQIIKNK